ncbi:protein maelstrom-like protein, partial [Dinothrombium tinctorium]
IIAEIGLQPPREQILEWLRTRRFYFLDFNIMCKSKVKNHFIYLPLEIGLIKYSIEKQVIDEFHAFIDCGPIPNGCASEALQLCEKHGIPVDNRREMQKVCPQPATRVVENLLTFFSKDSKSITNDKKFVCFTFGDKITSTYGGYEWLDIEMNIASEKELRLPEISSLSIYDLAYEIIRYIRGKEFADKPMIEHEFNTSIYDFETGINCKFHETIDNFNCALGNSRRMACVFSALMFQCFGTAPIMKPLNRIESEDNAIVKVVKFAELNNHFSIGEQKDDKNTVDTKEMKSVPSGFKSLNTVPPPPGFNSMVETKIDVNSFFHESLKI